MRKFKFPISAIFLIWVSIRGRKRYRMATVKRKMGGRKGPS